MCRVPQITWALVWNESFLYLVSDRNCEKSSCWQTFMRSWMSSLLSKCAFLSLLLHSMVTEHIPNWTLFFITGRTQHLFTFLLLFPLGYRTITCIQSLCYKCLCACGEICSCHPAGAREQKAHIPVHHVQFSARISKYALIVLQHAHPHSAVNLI